MESNQLPQDWGHTSNALRSLARSLLVQDADADDLVQNAALVALTRPPRTRTRAWLKRVLRNRIVDHQRAQQRHRSKHEDRDIDQVSQGAEDVVEQLESYELLSEVVRTLVHERREAIFLRYFEGLTPAEIADRLDIPVKTVKTRLNRALGELRTRLEQRKGRDWCSVLALMVAPQGDSMVPLTSILVNGAFMSKRIAISAVCLGLGLIGALFVFSALGLLPGGSSLNGTASLDPGGMQIEVSSSASGVVAVNEAAEDVRTVIKEGGSGGAGDVPALMGSLRVMVRWADGSPAAGVALLLYPRSPLLAMETQRQVSDASGIVEFSRLASGRRQVASDRGGSEILEITAGAMTRAEFLIPRHVDIEGRVADSLGRGVAGAHIWLTTSGTTWAGGRVVATADRQGRFFLRSVPPIQSLGALAADYSPSALIDLDDVDTWDSPTKIELVLTKPGGSLSGVVTDGRGEPVPNALVCVGEAVIQHIERRRPLRNREVWTPRTVCSDDQGQYRVEGLQPGLVHVAVLGRGYPAWYGAVEIHAERTAEFGLALLPGAVVYGVVTDPSGQPAEGVVVRASVRELDRGHPTQPRTVNYSVFGVPTAVTNAEGCYQIDQVTPGKLKLSASEGKNGTVFSNTRVELIAECIPGERLEWSPVLDPGFMIRGQALFLDGAPMKGMFVILRGENTGKRPAALTDREGRFRFVNLDAEHFTLRVQDFDLPKGAPVTALTKVWPDGREILVKAAYDPRPKSGVARVHGVVEDPLGRLEHVSKLHLELVTGSVARRDGMSFVFNSAKPGRNRIRVFSGNQLMGRSKWFELRAGDDLDAGPVMIEAIGDLRIRVTRAAGTETAVPRLRLHSSSGKDRIQIGGDTVKVKGVLVGSYRFSCEGPYVMPLKGTLEILADREAVLELALSPAANQFIMVHNPDNGSFGSLDLRIIDEKGLAVWEKHVEDTTRMRSPFRTLARLRRGEYSITAVLSTGERGSNRFAVKEHGDVPDVVIKLR